MLERVIEDTYATGYRSSTDVSIEIECQDNSTSHHMPTMERTRLVSDQAPEFVEAIELERAVPVE